MDTTNASRCRTTSLKIGRRQLLDEYAAWLAHYTWDWFGTGTFGKNVSAPVAKHAFDSFAKSIRVNVGNQDFGFVRVLEHGPRDARVHVHFLVCGIKKTKRNFPYVWAQRWRRRYGFAVIDTFDPKRGGIRYLLKSLLPDADFDIDMELPEVRQ